MAARAELLAARRQGRTGWAAFRVPEHRLAAALLGALALLLLLGASVPQQATTPLLEYARWRQQKAPLSLWLEAAGLTAAGRSVWLPLVVGPLMVLLARCTLRRWVALVRAWVLLRQRHGRLASRGALRRMVASLGSILFHASLLVALGALALSGATRFRGYAELAPGASMRDAREAYASADAGWWSPNDSDLTIHLEALRLEAWQGTWLREQAATIAVVRGGQLLARRELARGETLEVAGVSILLGPRSGPAVLLVAEGQAGRRAGWVHLPAWPGEQETATTFEVPGSSTWLTASLEGGGPGQVNAGVLVLRAHGGGSGEWRLRPGEAAEVGATRLRLAAIDAWTTVIVSRDPFLGWFFGALAAGLLGLAAATALKVEPREGVAGA